MDRRRVCAMACFNSVPDEVLIEHCLPLLHPIHVVQQFSAVSEPPLVPAAHAE